MTIVLYSVFVMTDTLILINRTCRSWCAIYCSLSNWWHTTFGDLLPGTHIYLLYTQPQYWNSLCKWGVSFNEGL